jgi:hypothetical protein
MQHGARELLNQELLEPQVLLDQHTAQDQEPTDCPAPRTQCCISMLRPRCGNAAGRAQNQPCCGMEIAHNVAPEERVLCVCHDRQHVLRANTHAIVLSFSLLGAVYAQSLLMSLRIDACMSRQAAFASLYLLKESWRRNASKNVTSVSNGMMIVS